MKFWKVLHSNFATITTSIGKWTTRWYTKSQIANWWIGQLVDSPNCGCCNKLCWLHTVKNLV